MFLEDPFNHPFLMARGHHIIPGNIDLFVSPSGRVTEIHNDRLLDTPWMFGRIVLRIPRITDQQSHMPNRRRKISWNKRGLQGQRMVRILFSFTTPNKHPSIFHTLDYRPRESA